jgi:hypothetical protein
MKTWLPVVFIVVLAGTGSLLWKRSNDAAFAKLHEELEAIHGEALAAAADRGGAGVRPEDARLPPRMVQGAAEAMPQPPQPQPQAKRERLSADASAAEPAQPRSWTSQDLLDHYDVAFATENVDSEWAARARGIAEERLNADLPPGSSVRSIDCRTSMCRIESSHADRDSYTQFARQSFQDPGTSIWNCGSFSTIVNDDSQPGSPIMVVSYVSRDGTNLSMPDPAEGP